MYFTENKELQRFEREMKIVPNFERKEVWEYADSCKANRQLPLQRRFRHCRRSRLCH